MNEKKKKALISIKKAQSLLDKIIQMTEDGDYCIDIMQQNLAAIGLLKSAHNQLMENHLQICFKDAVASKNKKLQQKMLKEIIKLNKSYNK